MIEAKIVFISYSWTTPSHEKWVIDLAERLISNGIDVRLDKWDLKEGNDKYAFMESMVNSKDINKVLIILDKRYSENANGRTGGVGTESQIISPEIYKNVSQEKFIPIITEKDDDGKAYIPTFLKGRIYIDLSSPDNFEENYESLLRNIHDRPVYIKPKLGKAPAYLFEDSPRRFKTSFMLRGFENQVNKNPQRVNSLLKEFLDEFYDSLKEYSIIFSSKDQIEVGKQICDNIIQFTTLRNDFISFIEILLKSELEFDIELIIKFLEKLPLYKRPLDGKSSWSEYEFDNYRIIIQELFLYLIMIGLKLEKYKFVEEFLYSDYFLQDKYNSRNEPSNFDEFQHYVNTIDPYYKQAFSKNLYSSMAELLITRIPEGYSKDLLVESDLLCYYIGVLNNKRWFPVTYVYKLNGYFDLFDRLISLRHFEKVKILFNVNTPIELQNILNKLKETDANSSYDNRMRYPNSFDSVKPLYSIIKIDTIGTKR